MSLKITFLSFIISFGFSFAQSQKVNLVRIPNEGIQPQAVMDSNQTLHLIYFKGKAKAGNIFYVKKLKSQKDFSKPIQINSQDGSAVAVGNIRGAQLAIGQDGVVHVVWNGSQEAKPRGPGGNPMLYTRLNLEENAFEKQRNLITKFGGIDGGGSVAADNNGNIYVTWHAMGNAKDEAGRAVYLASSKDNGKTFKTEKRVSPKKSGACGCCGMRAFVDSKNTLYIAYRAAKKNSGRNMILLLSTNNGRSFKSTTIQKWQAMVCPMSSVSFNEENSNVLVAWEKENQVFYANIKKLSSFTSAPGPGKNRKHPSVALNKKGKILFAWTEGVRWNQGGSLCWQLYDNKGKIQKERGKVEGVPVWSLITVVAHEDGAFSIVY